MAWKQIRPKAYQQCQQNWILSNQKYRQHSTAVTGAILASLETSTCFSLRLALALHRLSDENPLPHCHHSHQKEHRIKNPTYINQRSQQRDTSESTWDWMSPGLGTSVDQKHFSSHHYDWNTMGENKFRQQIVCWGTFKKHITDGSKALSALYFFNHHQHVLKEREWKINPNPAVTQKYYSVTLPLHFLNLENLENLEKI